MLDRYLELNTSYSRPFVFKLEKRGFYSEVNNLLNAVIYGLVQKRRLIVDESDFNGQSWTDLFDATLPSAPEHVIETIPTEWIIDKQKQAKNFSIIRRFVVKRHQRKVPLWFPSLRLWGSVLHVKRSIAAMLCPPRATQSLPKGLCAPFATFHIRRGDKTDGVFNKGRIVTEGEAISPQTYLDVLAREAPEIQSVFVITDDYRMVEELRKNDPALLILSFASEEERGYCNSEFTARSPEEKAQSLHRLIAAVQIAAASSIFIGEFRSNLSRFVPLWHSRPDRCLSVDSERNWTPA